MSGPQLMSMASDVTTMRLRGVALRGNNYAASFLKTHGFAPKNNKRPEYNLWNAMRTRCNNPRGKSFHRYGGRGIKVCESWMKFENFLAEMGQSPSKWHTLERIDNDGNYEPGNVQWQTRSVQARNQSTNVRIAINGVSMILADWLKKLGLGQTTYYRRVKSGMTPFEALTQTMNSGQEVTL